MLLPLICHNQCAGAIDRAIALGLGAGGSRRRSGDLPIVVGCGTDGVTAASMAGMPSAQQTCRMRSERVAYTVMADIVMADIVMAYSVTTHISVASVIVAYVVMAYIVIAYVVL